MNYSKRRQEILQEMESITRMEQGKLSSQAPASGAKAFHKLQCWKDGKNCTRYVPAHEVASVKEALAGHERFQELAKDFVQVTIALTRSEKAEDQKKTPRNPK